MFDRKISIHALREEGDMVWERLTAPDLLFLSTPSARRATPQFFGAIRVANNFYPRPPRGGRQFFYDFFVHFRAISIHALREEGDAPSDKLFRNCGSISIHALREEGDLAVLIAAIAFCRFLSTPSARRATCCCLCCRAGC